MDNPSKSIVPAPATTSTSLEQYKSECQRRLSDAHASLAAALKECGVASVTATYDGSGDSGQLEEAEYWDANGLLMKDAPGGELHEKVSEFLYDLVEVRHGGYENNEGGGGEFRWDLTEVGLLHEHWDYYIERDCSSYEGIV